MARKVAGVNEASSKLRTCIATVSIAGDFREKLAAISRAGFTGIEIFEQDSWPMTAVLWMLGGWSRIMGLKSCCSNLFAILKGYRKRIGHELLTGQNENLT